jgi:hypothetical protein
MPSVVGLDTEAATAKVQALGGRKRPLDLVPQYRVVHNSVVPSGRVVAETPRAGTTLTRDSFVLLTISLGPATAPGAPPCKPSELRATPGGPVSEGTDQDTTDVEFANASTSTCVLDGYPTIAILDAEGHVLSFSFSHSGDDATVGGAPPAIYLLPEGTAWVRMNQYRCGGAAQATPRTAVLALPSTGGAFPAPVSFTYCGAGQKLTVSPFEPLGLLLTPNAPVTNG